jgi:hypothetical protein
MRGEPRWVKLPIDRAAAWSSLSGYARAMGTELFRLHQEREVQIAGDWKTLLARLLELDGRERPPFFRALDEMAKVGVLVVTDATVRLLYTDTTLAAHRKHIASTSTSHPTHIATTSASQPHHIDTTSTPQVESSPRNDSKDVSQRERENREKESERDAGARAASPTHLLDRVAGVLNGSGTAAMSRTDLSQLTALMPVLLAEAQKRNLCVDVMVAKAWKRFREDPKVRANLLGRPGIFLNQWMVFLDDAPQRGIAPVSSIEEFEREARERAAREQHA